MFGNTKLFTLSPDAEAALADGCRKAAKRKPLVHTATRLVVTGRRHHLRIELVTDDVA